MGLELSTTIGCNVGEMKLASCTLVLGEQKKESFKYIQNSHYIFFFLADGMEL